MLPHRLLRRTAILGTACALAATPLLLVAATAHAALPAPNQTAVVSIDTTGTSGVDAEAITSDVSADGRFVVFASDATNVVTGVPNPSGNAQVYLRDVELNTTTLISKRTDNIAGNDGPSTDPVISADGNWIAFTSSASNLVAGVLAAPASTQVYLHQVGFGNTLLSAVGIAVGDGNSAQASISDDGMRVAFETEAENIVGMGIPAQVVVFTQMQIGLPIVSAVDGGIGPGDDESRNPSISGDGMTVAFESLADNLTGPSDDFQVYSRTLVGNQTRLVSMNLAGTGPADNDSADASVNVDGSLIAFDSFAGDLTANLHSNIDQQVYLRDMNAAATELISVSLTDTWSNDDADQPSISGDGNRVAFRSSSTDLVAGVTVPDNTGQLWVRDRTDLVDMLVTGTAADPLVGSGSVFRFGSRPAISQSGLFVAFQSDQTELTSTPTLDLQQVYLRALPIDFLPPVPTPTPTSSTGGGPSAAGGLASTGAAGLLGAAGLAAGLAGVGVATAAVVRRRKSSS